MSDLTPTPPTLAISLGHYEIVQLVGSGGMGEIYRARDTSLECDVEPA
jgi:serine/threonine protein kinase